MQRVKNIGYDDDDLYDDEDAAQYGDEAEEYTSEDKQNFASLTPVVQAELEEAGVQASDKEIQDSLWHYYWDVAKSVHYLKTSKTPKSAQQQGGVRKEKAKSKFDQAAETSAKKAGNLLPPPLSASEWFRDTPWTDVPESMTGRLVPDKAPQTLPKLLGGSSKLAKLAEERRKKAATTNQAPSPATNSPLDRLGKIKQNKENDEPVPVVEPKKYPIRKKREPTPPPREPTPPPDVPEDTGPDLRATPTAFGQALSTGSKQNPTTIDMPMKEILGADVAETWFDGPSPDDTVIDAQRHNAIKAQSPAVNSLSKSTEALKLDPAVATSAPSKVRSKGLDVPKLWKEAKSNRKASSAFVVIGHVDHGKSTLMGRLLLDTGAVSQRDIDKYKKQATELGKASFALAWVMDTGSEERERGVTVDIAQHHFSTETTDFTILDAPGHRDFVPNMIGGASMADVAVLVVDASQLESGMKGQTREHILLARAAGIKRVIVAVNKLDTTNPAWNEALFNSVSAEILKLLKQTGFAEDDIELVPCSGLSGANVVKVPPSSGPTAWVSRSHSTLLAALERSASSDSPSSLLETPLRLQIADVFRGGITNPLSISGRISAGSLQVGEALIIQPSGESAVVKAIEVADEPRDYAVAGQIVTLHLVDIEAQHLRVGDLACAAANPGAVLRQITARIEAVQSLLPQEVDVHIGRLHGPGRVSALVATLDDQGEVLKKKPKIVKEGQRARMGIVLATAAPVDVADRVVLRSAGATIAYGVVESLGAK